jgi:hypothetical protein
MTLTAIPERFSAGSTVRVELDAAEYSAADGWELTLYLAGAEVAAFVGDGLGTVHTFELDAASTAALPAGTYQWLVRAAKDDDVIDVSGGTLEVTPDLAAAAAGDLASWEAQALVVARAALKGQLTDGMKGFQIGNRAVENIDSDKLITIIAQLEQRVAAQRSPATFGRKLHVRFPTVSGQ